MLRLFRMSSFMYTVILSCILCKINGKTQVIDPTIINSTGSFYVASDYYNSGQYYRSGSLTCSASYCHIDCSAHYGCTDLNVYATSSLTTLVVQCLKYNAACRDAIIHADIANSVQLYCNYTSPSSYTYGACYNLTLRGRDVSTASIYCHDIYACYKANFYLENAGTVSLDFVGASAGKYANVQAADVANDVNIVCDGSNACSYADINTSNIGNSLTMSCSDLYGCMSTDIYCPTDVSCNINCSSAHSCHYTQVHVATKFNNKLNLDCSNSTSTSCIGADIVCEDSELLTSLIYSFSSGWTYNCNEEYGCCTIKLGNITCSPGVSCQIDCDTQTCTNYHIDATLATSLTLDCGANGCKGAWIECPVDISTSCNVQCPGSKSCEYASVETGTNKISKLKVKCGGTWSCQYMQFTLNSVEISNLYLDCGGSYGCQDMHVPLSSVAISNLHLNCTGSYSCSYLDIAGSSNINYFNMDCTATSACYHAIIEGKIGFNADIDCIAEKACEQATVDLVSTGSDVNVDITCVNPSISTSFSYGACYYAQFGIYGYSNYGVKTNNMSLVCGSNDCYHIKMNASHFYWFDADCNAPDSCASGVFNAATTDQFNLHCDNQGSCYSADVYCPYHRKEACNIDCAAYTDSCNNIDILVPSNYLYSYLDITCPSEVIYGTLNPCDSLDIKCTDPVKSAARLSWDYINNEWNCGAYTGSLYCCPYLMVKAPTAPTTAAPTTKAPTTNAPTTKAPAATMQTSITSTANLVTTAVTHSSTDIKNTYAATNIQGELQNDGGNNSNTIIIIIVVFSSLFFLLLVTILILIIFYLKTLNNKINNLQQNSIGVELMETSKYQNNKEIEMNKNKIDGNNYNVNNDSVIDHEMQHYQEPATGQEGNDNDIVEKINETAIGHDNELL